MLILIVLVVATSAERWLRGKSWFEDELLPAPEAILGGAIVGAVALALAVLAATPLLEAITPRSIEWTQITAIRGNASFVLMAALLAAGGAAAAELVFRRWAVERLRELGVPALVAVLVAALAEAVATPGNLLARGGAALAGAGTGLVYLCAGRRLAAAIACRAVFDVGAILLVGLRLV